MPSELVTDFYTVPLSFLFFFLELHCLSNYLFHSIVGDHPSEGRLGEKNLSSNSLERESTSLPLLLVNDKEVIGEENTRMDPTSSSTGMVSTAASTTLNRGQLDCRKSQISGLVCDETQSVAQRRPGGRQLHARRCQQMNSCVALKLTDMLDSEGASLNVEPYELLKNRMSCTISEATSSGYWSSRTSTARISQLSISDSTTDTEPEAPSSPVQTTYEIDRLPFDSDYWTTDSVENPRNCEEDERDCLSTLSIVPSHSGVSCNVMAVTEAVSKRMEPSSHPFYCQPSATPTHGNSYIEGNTKFRPDEINLIRGRSHSLPSNSHHAPNLSKLQSTSSFLSSNSSSASLDSDTTVGSPCELSGSLVSVNSANNGR